MLDYAPPPPPAVSALRPAIVARFIPFGEQRKRETAAYARRHYDLDTWRLSRPRVIVQHVAVAGSVSAVFNTFAPNRRDPELGELPGTCAHFVIDTDGTIVQLVAIGIVCRHTVGLNYTAIGIEHVGYSDGDVLDNPRQLRASLRLTRWLRCRQRIGTGNVIGHNESLSSQYHLERVERLQRQTHGDFRNASMRVYRRELRKLGPCPS